jgi:four helix bundle protein
MKEYSFERLDVWKQSKNFVVKIYHLTDNFPSEEKFGITSQLRRAAISVPTNLAEGSGRKTNKDKAHFTQIAFGSLMEVLNLLIIATELGFINNVNFKTLREDLEEISKMLSGLRNSQLNS